MSTATIQQTSNSHWGGEREKPVIHPEHQLTEPFTNPNFSSHLFIYQFPSLHVLSLHISVSKT